MLSLLRGWRGTLGDVVERWTFWGTVGSAPGHQARGTGVGTFADAMESRRVGPTAGTAERSPHCGKRGFTLATG